MSDTLEGILDSSGTTPGMPIGLSKSVGQAYGAAEDAVKKGVDLTEEAAERIKKNEQQEVGEKNFAYDSFGESLHKRQKELEEQHIPGKPFEAPTPEDPMQAFASPFMMLGLIASAFTKTPIASAFNAMSMGVKAIQEKNLTSYEQAMKEWKLNTDLAFKQASWENDHLRDIFENDKLTLDERLAHAEVFASANKMESELALMRAGAWDKLAELQKSKANLLSQSELKIEAAQARLQAHADALQLHRDELERRYGQATPLEDPGTLTKDGKPTPFLMRRDGTTTDLQGNPYTPVEMRRIGTMSPALSGSAPSNALLTPGEEGQEAGNDILEATGLDALGFKAIVDPQRLPNNAALKKQALDSAAAFAKRKNVDLSTFKAQYDGLMKVLNANTQRNSQVRVMENEIGATLDNFQPVADKISKGNLRAADVVRIWGGKETNSAIANEYSFDLSQLREEVAAYFAALQGRGSGTGGGGQSTIREADYKQAENLILNGVNRRALSGIRTAVEKSTQKMQPVLERSIDDARRGVWGLFGVGDKYKPQYGHGNAAAPHYKSIEEVVKAYNGGNGSISRDEAATILKRDFGVQ